MAVERAAGEEAAGGAEFGDDGPGVDPTGGIDRSDIELGHSLLRLKRVAMRRSE